MRAKTDFQGILRPSPPNLAGSPTSMAPALADFVPVLLMCSILIKALFHLDFEIRSSLRMKVSNVRQSTLASILPHEDGNRQNSVTVSSQSTFFPQQSKQTFESSNFRGESTH